MTYKYDSELSDFVGMMPDTDLNNPEAARATMRELAATVNTQVDASHLAISSHTIRSADDSADIPVRLYRQATASSSEPKPAILFIHAGGFVIGDLDTEHSVCTAIATALDVVIASVDYRLAPEYPYPAAIDDCYSGLQWLKDKAATLGIDTTRIAIMGQSAGGGLAASLALMARDKQGPAVCFQFLGVPELDDTLSTPSMQAFVDTPLWSRRSAEASWKAYLGDAFEPGGEDVPAYAAAARADDLSGLPPAYICAMEFDPLRDENIQYALRLLQAGVSTELHSFAGTFHGSSMIATARVSQRQNTEMIAVLAKALQVEIASTS
ncbi:MAG: alpha/beta hydrolase [Spongiibacteraceae bacterium]